MNKKAQSTLEYAVVIFVVSAALIAMTVYIKRGLQGNMRNNADQISGAAVYSPGATNFVAKTTRNIEENSKSWTEKSLNPSGTEDQVSHSRSWGNITQENSKDQLVPSFSAEPKRWQDE